MALIPNININEAIFLLKTKSYTCLTAKLQKAIRFNATLLKETDLNDFLALLRRILRKFYDKPYFERVEECLLIEVFKSYESCVGETRVKNVLLQDKEFLQDVRLIIKWPFLTPAILQFLNKVIPLCTHTQWKVLGNIFFDNILLLLRERCCLEESIKTFSFLFLLKSVSLSYIDYELLIKLYIQNSNSPLLKQILKNFCISESFWMHFSGLDIRSRFPVLSILCELDIETIDALPNNCPEVLVYLFKKCNFKFGHNSLFDKLKTKEAWLLLGFIHYLMDKTKYSNVLQTNMNLLIACAAFCNNIHRLEKSYNIVWTENEIDTIYVWLMNVIAKFPERIKKSMMLLPSLVS